MMPGGMNGTAPAAVPGTAFAVLDIDLDAIVANWRLLADRLARSGAACAGVVKADAYGLGAGRVGPALAAAGCGTFFVATPDEGVALRNLLPAAEIHVLGGLAAGSEAAFLEHRLVPVLNDLAQVERWGTVARDRADMPCDLHVDTGMARLGLEAGEVERLAGNPDLLARLRPAYLMSHLACADTPDHPMNEAQREAFLAIRRRFPAMRASFANSGGVFLGRAYHFDLARPGIALYGGAPQEGPANPMHPVVRLRARILQVRAALPGMTVGYGATHRVQAPGRIATVALGYADGYRRALSDRGSARVAGVTVPVIGRVSMDLVTLDVSTVPEALAGPGDWVEMLGPDLDADAVAGAAGTISYEILTGLGRRFHRTYKGGGAG